MSSHSSLVDAADQQSSGVTRIVANKQSKQQQVYKVSASDKRPQRTGEGGHRPKRPKGPKGGKPKPLEFEFYHQYLAAELAKAALAQSAPVKATPSISVFDRESKNQRAFTESLGKTGAVSCSETSETTTSTVTTVVEERHMTIQVPEAHKSSQTSSSTDLSGATLTSCPESKPRCKTRNSRHTTITLNNIEAVEVLLPLIEQYGGVQHGGILDSNYSFFVNRARTAAISFIVKDKTAVLGGDPLCDPSLFDSVFSEFSEYRKQAHIGIAIVQASSTLLAYSKHHNWASIRVGTERVLNPLTNPVLHQKVQKQIIRQNKQLLDPARHGLTLGYYSPSSSPSKDLLLQTQLRDVYNAWRAAKNGSGRPQPYTTVYDPFALPSLMTYIYTRDRSGAPNGFAALRRLGNKNGYYIDPCVAAPTAPRRIPDLLYFAAMALLHARGCAYLSVGMEPCAELEMCGFPRVVERAAKGVHRRVFEGLGLGGKAEYFGKWRPDASREAEADGGLYSLFPRGGGGVTGVWRLGAVMHVANLRVRGLVVGRLRGKGRQKDKDGRATTVGSEEREQDGAEDGREGVEGGTRLPRT